MNGKGCICRDNEAFFQETWEKDLDRFCIVFCKNRAIMGNAINHVSAVVQRGGIGMHEELTLETTDDV